MTNDLDIWKDAETPAVVDALDQLGSGRQVLSTDITPLDESSVMVGRARTMQFAPGETQQDYDELIDFMTSFIDSLKPGEVPVVACGLPNRYTIIGEILATAAQMRGSPGWVTDGFIRDAKGIRDIGYQAFCAGFSPLSFIKRAKVISVDKPIICGGVAVTPGDLMVGDADGCVAVPYALSSEVLKRLQVDLAADVAMKSALRAGRPLREALAETH
jgi:4-hydroxy-4-methyl-2-oxoglutarate aldolase